MAVILQQTMPEAVPVDMLDEVGVEMDIHNDPPKGLVVHVHFSENGRTRVVDVWESVQDIEAFRNERLMPAIQKVAARRGVSLDTQPESSVIEVAEIVYG